MEELKELLENYFILKEDNKELYYTVKDNYKTFKTFITDKLGYELLIRGDFIKLEKLPGKPEGWMGIDAFGEIKEYIFFMLLLMFLEDKNKEDQFLLSHITEYISSNYFGEKVDWTDYSTRRSLIKVMKFALDEKILIVNDGEEEEFVKNNSTEVLYESTGLSKYMVRNFPMDIMKCKSYKDLVDDHGEYVDIDRGFTRKNRVYRRLLLSPVVYNESVINEGNINEDYIYIKNYRNIIEEDFRKYLNWKLHVHRNASLIVLGDKDRFKNVFPNNSTLSDIVLQLNNKLRKLIENKALVINTNSIAELTNEEFKDIVKELKESMGHGWSKEFREGTLDKLYSEVLQFMKDFSMITEDKNIQIYSLVGKIIGDYPMDYSGGTQNGK